jgi:hypothetical protein
MMALLPGPLPPVMLSIQRIPGLQPKHLRQATIYALLRPIGDEWTMASTAGSAMAASGIGLCQNYRYLPDCDVERANMPIRFPLGIHFSNYSLATTLAGVQDAASAMEYTRESDWTLGRNTMPGAGAGNDDYWTRLREAIQRLPRESSHKPIDIFLMGDAASNEQFQKALLDALHDVLPPVRPIGLSSANANLAQFEDVSEGPRDLTFLVARGAAELGKRRIEQPDGCMEPAFYKWWRGESSDLNVQL